MKVVGKRALLGAMVLLLPACQSSNPVVNTNQNIRADGGSGMPNQAYPAAYIGRRGSREALTIVLIPQKNNEVLVYYGLAGNIPLSDVKIDQLDRIGTFELDKPLSDGIFFSNPNEVYRLRRETDSDAPGSVLYGSVQYIDSYQDVTVMVDFFPYTLPAGVK